MSTLGWSHARGNEVVPSPWQATNRQLQLHSAIASRDLIGQAKGMLMERFEVGSDEAFVLLRKLSQERNVPLRKIAGHVVETGR